jgi:signal transduction histidine kinase
LIASAFMAGHLLDLSVGMLEAAVAITLIVHLRRPRFAAPLLSVLAAFFALRAGEHLALSVSPSGAGSGSGSLSVVVDLCVVTVLAALIVITPRVFVGLEQRWDAAVRREREYERAVVDYRRLARHRVANPLTAILGSARALRDLPDLDRRTQRQLLEIIVSESQRLQNIDLDPRSALATEERSLRPVPGGDVQRVSSPVLRGRYIVVRCICEES